jgi:hypothetical protein
MLRKEICQVSQIHLWFCLWIAFHKASLVECDRNATPWGHVTSLKWILWLEGSGSVHGNPQRLAGVHCSFRIPTHFAWKILHNYSTSCRLWEKCLKHFKEKHFPLWPGVHFIVLIYTQILISSEVSLWIWFRRLKEKEAWNALKMTMPGALWLLQSWQQPVGSGWVFPG